MGKEVLSGAKRNEKAALLTQPLKQEGGSVQNCSDGSKKKTRNEAER